MKCLIACEYSGIVRTAFEKKGWDATSCDLLPTEIPGKHYQGNVFDILYDGWDLLIAFPPCTFLTVTANRHRWQKQLDALIFVHKLMTAPIKHIGFENPVGVLSTYIRKPDQIIHPYFFGDAIQKKTCLWLKNLPPLIYSLEDTLFERKTSIDPEYFIYNSQRTKSGKSKYSVYGKLGSGSGKERSKFFPGIANAMAEQWTKFLQAEI